MKTTPKIDQLISALRSLARDIELATEETHDYVNDLNLDFEWSYDTGVSKCVFLIRGEQIVLKVPFHRMHDTESYNSDLEYFEECRENKTECEYSEPVFEEYYRDFECAYNDTLICDAEEREELIEFKGDDYCELECAIYQEAIKKDVAQYLAAEEWIDCIGGTDIYIQQRVIPFESYYENHGDDEMSYEQCESTKTRCKSLGVRCLNPVWVRDFFEAYGEEEYQRLLEFLAHLRISDFHNGNLGYYDDKPILMDYSDFNEW